MPTSAGAVYVDIEGNSKPLETKLNSLGSVAGKVGKIIGAALISKAAIDFGKKCVELASDLNEVQNVVDVTFSHMSGKVDEWARSAAGSFGLSETMAKRYAGTFGSMAEAFGFTEQQAYEMGTTLSGLAGDVASFYNISQDLAYTKLKSVFSGETETLKDLGIVMTQSALDAYALANGYGKLTKDMTEAEKVSLRYAFVQSQLANAAGDFSRTSGSWANQVRLLQLRFDQLKATIGQSLIAALLPVVRVLNAIILAATNAAEALNRVVEAITGKSMGELTGGATGAASVVSDLGGAASVAAGSTDDLADAQGNAARAARDQDKAQKALNRTLAGFDRINKLSSQNGGTATTVGSASVPSVGDVGLAGLGDSAQAEADKANRALAGIKVPATLLASIDRLKKSASDLAKTVTDGLGWAYENVLKPLGEFTINTVLPDTIDLLADALGHLNDCAKKLGGPLGRLLKMAEGFAEFAWTEAIQPLLDFATNEVLPRVLDAAATAFDILVTCMEKLQPVAKWLWDNIVKPLANAIGKALVWALDRVNDALKWYLDTISKADFSGFVAWLDDHKDFVKWLLGLLVVKKVSGPLKAFGGTLRALFKVFKGSKIASLLVKPLKALFALVAAHPIVAIIAAVAAGILLIWKNWDKIKKTKFGKALIAAGKALKGVWENVKGLASSVKDKLAGALEGAKKKIDDFRKGWESVKDKTVTLFTETKEKVEGALATIKESWDSLKDRTATLLAEAKATVNEKWESVKEAFTGAGEWFTDKTATVTATVGASVDNAWQAAKDAFKWVKDNAAAFVSNKAATITATVRASVASLWDKAKAAFEFAKKKGLSIKKKLSKGSISASVEAAFKGKKHWNKVLEAFEWVKENTSKFKSKKATISATVKTTLGESWDKIKDLWDWAHQRGSHFINKSATLTAKIANWDKKAYESLKGAYDWAKDNFKSKTATLKLVFNAAITNVKAAANAIIDGINARLNGIYWPTFKVAGKTVGGGRVFPNNPIPRLAQGGWVARNTPRLAVIGDNPREGEIVSPESKLQAMADRAAGGGGDLSALLPVLNEILGAIRAMDTGTYLDGAAITRKVVANVNAQTRTTGRCPIVV